VVQSTTVLVPLMSDIQQRVTQPPLHEVQVTEHLPSLLYTVENVLTGTECDALIHDLEFTKMEEKLQESLIKEFEVLGLKAARTNIRRTVIHKAVAHTVWNCLKDVLPTTLEDGRTLAGVRSRMFFYKYSPGQFFSTHIDGGHRFRDTGETSEYTFVLYLNDNFSGGKTRFCPQPLWHSTDQENGKVDGAGVREVKPICGGMLVLHQRGMKHCGVTLIEGCKYILQGMVMYGPVSFSRLGEPVGKAPESFTQAECDVC